MSLLRKIPILAHTGVQLEIFMRNHAVAPDEMRRITDLEHIYGSECKDRNLVLLPGWKNVRQCFEIVHYWISRGGEVVLVNDNEVLSTPSNPEEFKRKLFGAPI